MDSKVIPYSIIRLIAKTMKDLKLQGSCITLGVQGVQGNYSEIKQILMEEAYKYQELGEKEICYDNLTPIGKSLHQDCFFRMLGFSKVDSLDYFPNENPTIIADLNKPLSSDLYNQYDLVYDGGTLEHCFNTKEVLANVIKLLKVGGRVVHTVPMTGWINHGFYQFSPGLFFDFYGANGFANLKSMIQLYGERSYCLDYDPEMISIFNIMKKPTLIFFTAQKTTEVGSIEEPIQSYYLTAFGGKSDRSTTNSRMTFKGYLIKMLDKLPENKLSSVVYTVAEMIYSIPKIINLYKKMVRLN